jgi:hypothetical protein
MVRTASKPAQPIKKSTAGARPLTQASPSTRKCDWMARCAALLEPLYERAKRLVLAPKVVQTGYASEGLGPEFTENANRADLAI